MPPVKNRPMPRPAPTAPHPPVTFMSAIRTPLLVQLAHIALSSLWNGAGLWRVTSSMVTTAWKKRRRSRCSSTRSITRRDPAEATAFDVPEPVIEQV